MLPGPRRFLSGYYAWLTRAPSVPPLRHAWLTEQVQAVHAAPRGTYGSRRVHAELRLGRGIVVGYHAVEMPMPRGGIKGLPRSRRPRPRSETPTLLDLVNRDFARAEPLVDRRRILESLPLSGASVTPIAGLPQSLSANHTAPSTATSSVLLCRCSSTTT